MVELPVNTAVGKCSTGVSCPRVNHSSLLRKRILRPTLEGGSRILLGSRNRILLELWCRLLWSLPRSGAAGH